VELAKRKIVLGVSGGVAAYKAAELARRLRDEGALVQAVMTASARQFIGAATLQALTGQPVHDDLWDRDIPDGMGHISLTRDADALLVAPASANLMARLAAGICDDLLSAMALARRRASCRLLLAPAMNVEMWEHPATQRNVARLLADGTRIAGPARGSQACGESGLGRMLEPDQIVAELIASFQDPVLHGRRVLLSAGPTFEAIDPVRGITNRSSGKMGYALARAAWEAGAQVTLVSGPTSLAAPHGVQRIDVLSAQEMFDQVLARVEANDVYIGVAAVADWRPAHVSVEKLKKRASATPPTLQLANNPDILASVAALPAPPLCVGFAAESENIVEHARAKLHSKSVAMIVANQVRDAVGGDEVELTLVDDTTTQTLPRAAKLVQARLLVAAIARRLGPPGPS